MNFPGGIHPKMDTALRKPCLQKNKYYEKDHPLPPCIALLPAGDGLFRQHKKVNTQITYKGKL